jgi:hypothetical protein
MGGRPVDQLAGWGWAVRQDWSVGGTDMGWAMGKQTELTSWRAGARGG